MAGSPYASALGRLKPEFTSFLPRETFASLLAARDPNDVAKLLETTAYAPDIVRARATHPGSSMLEVAVNRTFVRRNRHAYDSSPFAGRAVVAAYLARWDIENIELILSAKATNRPVTETEDHLVSSREIPAGLYAGVMTLDDFRIVLSQPTLEATATALVQYGYGSTILPLLEAFERSHDIFPIFNALDRAYYRNVLSATRFFQGDEWVVRAFLADEVDARNALLLLKGKSAELPLDQVVAGWLEGGAFSSNDASDVYSARGVPELAERLGEKFPSVGQGVEEFRSGQSLVGFEVALQRDRAAREMKRLATYPLSLSVIFAYLLRNEIERADLRRIAFGKLYGLSADRLSSLLVSTAF